LTGRGRLDTPFGMGVEMRIFLIPCDQTFRPGGAALASFVEALRAQGYVVDPSKPSFSTMTYESMRHHAHAKATGALVMTPANTVARIEQGVGYESFPKDDLAKWFSDREDSDVRIVWPVEHARSLRYPLNKHSPAKADDTSYEIEIRLSREYSYVTSKSIDPFDDVRCACGENLVFEEEEDMRIWRRCRKCGAPFVPSSLGAVVRDPWTQEPTEVRGGATFRFAFVIDCGKCWPDEPGLGIEPELRRLCEAHFAQPFYEVIEVY
jgi:hypothetical protein